MACMLNLWKDFIIEISPIAVSQVYKPASTIGDIGDYLSNFIITEYFELVKQCDIIMLLKRLYPCFFCQ